MLRGGEALVFPVTSRYLDFQFQPQTRGGVELFIEDGNKDLRLAFAKVFEHALQLLAIGPEQIHGQFYFKSNIPVGAGMGASATLCVSLAQLFYQLSYLPSQERFSFAQKLENIFHGESSGVDVAVALENKPLIFRKGQPFQLFKPLWQPTFYLSFCGEKGMTADCVYKVQELFKQNPHKAEFLDHQMKSAVALAQTALRTPQDLNTLSAAIDQALQCFEGWDLIGDSLLQEMTKLKDMGALAVKPTGSGQGGFVLSLWSQPLSAQQEQAHSLIRA